MTDQTGRTVRLYLVEGSPTGLIASEIINWTGHVLAGPRSGLPALLKRGELDRTGIYLLLGPDPDDPDLDQLYIGESDNVGKRLVQHNKDESKDFWERTCVITSKDQNITKAHARYLEARIIALANAAANASVINGTAPTPPPLPEADASDMEYFIEQVRIVLPLLGFNILRKAKIGKLDPSSHPTEPIEAEEPILELVGKNQGVRARARDTDGEFTVLAGSEAVLRWNYTEDHTYAKLHQNLLRLRKLVPDGAGKLKFSDDVVFKSPSAASSVILGRPDNGRQSWKLEGTARTYAEWQNQQIGEAAADEGIVGQ